MIAGASGGGSAVGDDEEALAVGGLGQLAQTVAEGVVRGATVPVEGADAAVEGGGHKVGLRLHRAERWGGVGLGTGWGVQGQRRYLAQVLLAADDEGGHGAAVLRREGEHGGGYEA